MKEIYETWMDLAILEANLVVSDVPVGLLFLTNVASSLVIPEIAVWPTADF